MSKIFYRVWLSFPNQIFEFHVKIIPNRPKFYNFRNLIFFSPYGSKNIKKPGILLLLNAGQVNFVALIAENKIKSHLHTNRRTALFFLLFILLFFTNRFDSSVKIKPTSVDYYHLWAFCWETGSRTPILRSRAACPAIRRSPKYLELII